MFSERLMEVLERVETSPALLRLKMLELRNTLEECREAEVRAEGQLVLDALRQKILHQPNFSLADVAAKLKTYDEVREDVVEPDAEFERPTLRDLFPTSSRLR